MGVSVFNANNFPLKLNDYWVESSDSIDQLLEYSRIPFIMMGDTGRDYVFKRRRE